MRFAAILLSLAVLLIQTSSVYAGKVELTTYYPASYGEYKDLKASTTLQVPVKTADPSSPPPPQEIWVDPTTP